MLLAAFMAVTSVGWTHAQGTSGDGYEKTNDGYKVTTAAGFETVLGILNGESGTTPAKITLAQGTYTLEDLVEVKKDLTVVGTDSTDCVINGKFRINGSGQQAVSFNNVKINCTDTTITLTNPEVTLTLDAAAVYGSHCVKFNDYTATKAPTYIVKNSALHARTHYALWTRSTGTYTWKIDNSLLEGWCALYTSLGTPDITVSKSHLYGTTTSTAGNNPAYTNGHSGNGFATIVFENTQNGKVLLDNTDVKSNWSADAKDILNSVIFQVWESNNNTAKLGATGNVVELKNGSSFWIEKPDFTPIFVYHGASGTYGSVTNNWVTTDGTATFKYGTDNLSAMVISNNGNIRTAVAPVQGGIDNMNSWTADGDVVTFPNAGSIDLTKQWVIQNAITLKGNKTSIQATGEAWPKNGDKIVNTANLISVEGSKEGTVTLEGLSILNSKAAGINAQSKMKTVLKDVTLKNNATAGLIVHSAVEATGLHTEGNTWGGVNVDKGTPDHPLSFTFDATSTFAESSKIWAEKDNVQPSAVTVPSADWTYFEGLGGGEGKTPMYYWTNSKLISEKVTAFYGDKELGAGSYTLVYANGNPITVAANGNDGIKISAGSDDVLVLKTSDNPIIFGGAKYSDTESSNITMTGGEVYMLVGGGYLGNVKNANITVTGGNVTKYLVGGGYGPSQSFTDKRKTADVTGKASVKIENATVRYLISGGMLYAKTAATDVAITGDNTKISYALGGGFAPVGSDQSLDKDFAATSNTIATANFSMTGGTVNGAICLGGGYSYSYTKDITATLNGVTINGGLYGIGWNGNSDKVDATVSKCTFKKAEGYTTIAALVRGKANEVSMNFDNCTFDNENGYECYLGADADWQDGNYPTPVSGKTTMTFAGSSIPAVKVSEGMQDVVLNGAKVNVNKFLQKTNGSVYVSTFSVPSGKTWSFQKGMTIGEGVTLTNSGTLNVAGIDNETDLRSAVSAGANKIGLTKGEFELTSQLKLSKPVSISGVITDKDTTTIAAAAAGAWTQCADKNDSTLLNIVSSDKVSLNNLNIKNSQRNGINIFESKDVTLNNVSVSNSKAAGLVINSSTVAATNFRTSGSGWGYGVNVDKGSSPSQGAPDPVFTIGSGCSFAEAVAIVSDKKDAPASYVVGNGWFKTTKGNASVWINGATSGLNFAITSVPSSVIYGQANLPLLTNVDSAYIKAGKVKITIDKENIAKIENDSLKILKPGKVNLTLAVGDTTVVQPLEVLKKTLTITGITGTTRDYNGSDEVDLVTTNMEVKGLVGDHTVANVITAPTKGKAESANAGVQPVEVTATLKTDGSTNYSEYYELAKITGVTDTIKKVELTVTATVAQTKAQNADTLSVDYGKLPTFGVTYSGFVNSENKDSEGVLKGDVKYNSSATTTSLAGTYSVTPSGLTADNYDIKYVSAPFKIKAVAPTVEMTGIEVASLGTEGSSNASVKVTGHVTSNGGTKTTALKGDFKVKANGSYVSKGLSLTVDKDGMFFTTLENLSQTETHILASAKASESLASPDGDGDEKAMSVNLALKLQNVSFASAFKTLTYGAAPITLSAKDFEEGAKVVFTSSDAAILAIQDSNQIVVKKPGVATITVTATKDQYITAIAKQTITVNKKALAVTPETITKPYDGTTEVQVKGTLPDLGDLQTATLSSASLDANFASKNVGQEIAVALADEFKLSTGSDYYELIQPTNLTGSITSGGDVTVVVSNVSRRYNEKALHYDLAFQVNGKELVSPAYTGTVSVTETTTGTYQVNAAITIPNYGKVTATPADGDVVIERGTPKVLTYNNADKSVGGLLLDKEGWEDAELRVIGEADNKAHASVYYKGGTDSIVGRTLTVATPPSFDWGFQVPAANRMLKATKAVTNASVQYGQTATFSKQTGVSFESSNPNVFVVKEGTGNMIIETVGVGTAAVIAKGSGNNAGVTCLQVEVTPKTIKLQANTITKVYDGTTSANVTLTPDAELIGATLDLEGVSFNFANSNVGSSAVTPSKDIVLKNNNEALASAANYTLSVQGLTGSITQRELTFTGTEVNKFYDGTSTATLTDYAATGLIDGEAIPALTATFTKADANNTPAEDVATGLKVALKLQNENGNYSLKTPTTEIKGNIVKSTIDATLPEGASDVENLKNNVKLVVRETGATVTRASIHYEPTATAEGTGDKAVYYISGGDNDNYSVVYDKNQIGYKATVTPPSGGSDDDATVTISLDATEKTLPRLEEFVLKATVSPAGQTVTWSSSDPTIASVTADGNKATVKALKVGTATITAKIGSVTATCEVTVDFATGLEEALANTQIYAKQGSIYVNPIQPLQLTIVNMLGKIVYNARISSYAQIPVTNGIYIVKLTNAGNTIVTKVNVY